LARQIEINSNQIITEILNIAELLDDRDFALYRPERHVFSQEPDSCNYISRDGLVSSEQGFHRNDKHGAAGPRYKHAKRA
jgi:hypothetical protein